MAIEISLIYFLAKSCDGAHVCLWACFFFFFGGGGGTVFLILYFFIVIFYVLN